MRNIGKTATFKRIKTISFTRIIHSSAEMPILPFSPLSLIRRPTNLGITEVGEKPLIEFPTCHEIMGQLKEHAVF